MKIEILTKDEIECEDLFWNVEMPLVPVLAHMEMTGVCIDRLPHRSAILLMGIIVIVEAMRNVSMTQLRAISLAPYAFPISGSAVVRALLVNGLMNETIIIRIKIVFS